MKNFQTVSNMVWKNIHFQNISDTSRNWTIYNHDTKIEQDILPYRYIRTKCQ